LKFLLATLERREARVESSLDRDQVFIGQRTDPRQVNPFGYDSHLDLLIRHYVAYRPASISFHENDNAPPEHLSSGALVVERRSLGQ
jgi:hypothetical protein